jgi:hypothetical protein
MVDNTVKGQEDSGAGQDDVNWWTGDSARVFISCGQGEGEESTAGRIRDLIRDKGFAPYLAIEVHSPQAITQGIYQKLTTADYFLFVDFSREPVGKCGESRGSLFSNQELGIASYLEIETLPFLQEGVSLEGILRYIQGNPIRFKGVTDLLEKIKHEIGIAAWQPLSRKELEIERDPGEVNAAWIPQTDAKTGQHLALPVRYYHLALHNRHWRLLATNCIVHVLGIRNAESGKVVHPDTVELKFKHVTSPSVAVPPNSRRQFDGVIVPDGNPSMAIVGILNPGNIDSGSIIEQHKIQGPGDFELDLVAYSREFRPAKATASLHLGSGLDDVKFSILKPKHGRVAPVLKHNPGA